MTGVLRRDFLKVGGAAALGLSTTGAVMVREASADTVPHTTGLGSDPPFPHPAGRSSHRDEDWPTDEQFRQWCDLEFIHGIQSRTPPIDKSALWLDQSQDRLRPAPWKCHDGSAWVPTSATKLNEHIVGRGIGSYLGWQSVKGFGFGAKGDGVADDTTAIQSALDASVDGTCYIPDGKYRVSSALIIPKNCAVIMGSNAVVKACAAMEAVFLTRNEDEQFNNVISGGRIDCNGRAASGIWIKWFSMFRVEDLEIWDSVRSGIRLGNALGRSSYEAIICSARIRRTLIQAAPKTRGIEFEFCGDSHVSDTVIMGVRSGISGSISDSKFDRVHVWNPEENGPLEYGFHIGGQDNVLTQCQVDGDCLRAAYYLEGTSNKLLGCATNHVAWGSDLSAVCVQVGLGSRASILGCTFKGYSSSVRWASDYTLAEGASIDFVGNSSVHVLNAHDNSLANAFRASVVGTDVFIARNLPRAAVRGDRAFVIDANSTAFASRVEGGGGNRVPVVYDGENWLIG